jgi:hypothetical protein
MTLSASARPRVVEQEIVLRSADGETWRGQQWGIMGPLAHTPEEALAVLKATIEKRAER